MNEWIISIIVVTQLVCVGIIIGLIWARYSYRKQIKEKEQ